MAHRGAVLAYRDQTVIGPTRAESLCFGLLAGLELIQRAGQLCGQWEVAAASPRLRHALIGFLADSDPAAANQQGVSVECRPPQAEYFGATQSITAEQPAGVQPVVAHRIAEAFDLGERPRFGGSGGFVDDRVGGALDECNDVAGQSTLIGEGLNDHSKVVSVERTVTGLTPRAGTSASASSLSA